MFRATFFLRAAAVLALIHAVLHTIGGVFGKPDPGPAAVAFAAMQSNHFLLMGSSRSYAEFYLGFGIAVSIFLTAEAFVFWQLGSLAKTEARRLRPILVTFLVGYIALAVNSQMYFFIAPVIVEVLIALCLVGAIVTAKASVGDPAHVG